MSTTGLVHVGAAVAQAAIDTAAKSIGDNHAALLRVGVLEFLRVHASQVQTDGPDNHLLQAYRDWLDTAVYLYSTGDPSEVRQYVRQGGLLAAEMELSAANTAETPAPTPHDSHVNGTESP